MVTKLEQKCGVIKKSIFVVVMVVFHVACTGMQIVEPTPELDGITIRPITAELVNEMALRQKSEFTELSKTLGAMSEDNYQYLVGSQDVLNITVWDHPELTIPQGQFRNPDVAGNLIFQDGTIFFPYVGYLHVAGKKMPEIQDQLTRKLSVTIQNPQVSVSVAVYRNQKAYVVGEVNSPGPKAITNVPLTILEAIGQAGDATADADLTKVTLTRERTVYDIDLLAIYQDGDPNRNVLLKNGDVLHIPNQSLRKVFVMGETSDQISLLLDQNRRTTTLTEALSDAGGIDQITSNPGRIFVLRGTDTVGERLIFHIDAKSPDALILADHFQVLPRDVVYVGTAGVTRWNRVVSQLIPGQLTNFSREARQ
jgi:polysaccharide export outer membrane protein